MAEPEPRTERRGGRPPAGGEALRIPRGILRRIVSGLQRAYPTEGCGVLLGRVQSGAREVERAVGAANRWAGRLDRYRVDPSLLRRLLEEEDAGGPRVLGFYHSHPDHEPVPSETDRANAWPWYHYLIVPLGRTGSLAPRAWELDPGSGRFSEREVRLGEDVRLRPRTA